MDKPMELNYDIYELIINILSPLEQVRISPVCKMFKEIVEIEQNKEQHYLKAQCEMIEENINKVFKKSKSANSLKIIDGMFLSGSLPNNRFTKYHPIELFLNVKDGSKYSLRRFEQVYKEVGSRKEGVYTTPVKFIFRVFIEGVICGCGCGKKLTESVDYGDLKGIKTEFSNKYNVEREKENKIRAIKAQTTK